MTEKDHPHLHNRSIKLLMLHAVPEARISDEALNLFRQEIELWIIKKTREAYSLARHGNRKTILPEDISIALRKETLWPIDVSTATNGSQAFALGKDFKNTFSKSILRCIDMTEESLLEKSKRENPWFYKHETHEKWWLLNWIHIKQISNGFIIESDVTNPEFCPTFALIMDRINKIMDVRSWASIRGFIENTELDSTSTPVGILFPMSLLQCQPGSTFKAASKGSQQTLQMNSYTSSPGS